MDNLSLLIARWDLFVRIWIASKDSAMDPPQPGTFPEANEEVIHLSAAVSVGACFIISVIYVASLYVWRSKHDR